MPRCFPHQPVASVLKKFPADHYCWESSPLGGMCEWVFSKRQGVLGWGGKRIGWEGDLVVHPNLNFHWHCSKSGTSMNCCSDASPTSWVVWSDAVLLVANSNAGGGSLKCKACEGHLCIKTCLSWTFDKALVFIYLESIQCSAVGRQHRISGCLRSRGVRSQGLLPNSHRSGSCSSPCIPGVGCCSRIPLVLWEVLPGRHRGRLLSPGMWRGISAVAASCHLQFHMSEFSLTFSNNTKNMWLTSEKTHLF